VVEKKNEVGLMINNNDDDDDDVIIAIIMYIFIYIMKYI